MVSSSPGLFHQKQKSTFEDLIISHGFVLILGNPLIFIPLLSCTMIQMKTFIKYHWIKYRTEKTLLQDYQDLKHYIMFQELLQPLDPDFYQKNLEIIAQNITTDLHNLDYYEEQLGIKSSVKDKISSQGWQALTAICNKSWPSIHVEGSTHE